eukprot:Ihof_evm8s170 gene=Ihof_evmTU8s170
MTTILQPQFNLFASPDLLPLGPLILLLKVARSHGCYVRCYVHSSIPPIGRQKQLASSISECISKHYSWEDSPQQPNNVPLVSIIWCHKTKERRSVCMKIEGNRKVDVATIHGNANICRFLCRYFGGLRPLYNEYKYAAQAAEIDQWLSWADDFSSTEKWDTEKLFVTIEQHLYMKGEWWMAGNELSIADVTVYALYEEAVRKAHHRLPDMKREYPRINRLEKCVSVLMSFRELKDAIYNATQIGATTYEVDEEYDIVAVKGLIHPDDMTAWFMLLKQTRERIVVPFVGAGISMPGLPGWQQLLTGVSERTGRPLDGLASPCKCCGGTKLGLHIVTDIIKEKMPK